MRRKPRILFLCTGNACRSQMAEAILRHLGGERFEAASAGSQRAGFIHPLATETLATMGIPLGPGARSKAWTEFVDDPPDAVITVCDSAAAEVCPIWPDAPLTVHWPLPDPVALRASEAERLALARRVAEELIRRIARLVALDWKGLSPDTLRSELGSIAARPDPRRIGTAEASGS